MNLSNDLEPLDTSAAFLRWFQAQPGAYFSPHIRLAPLASRGHGRGILATADIPANTNLLVVPRRTVLGIETSDVARKLPHVFNLGNTQAASSGSASDDGSATDEEELNPGLELILVLIYEHLHRASSPWRPYLDVLPHAFDTLMYWNALELRELQASTAAERINWEHADRTFRERLVPLIHKHAGVFYPVGTEPWSDDGLVRLAHRMGSIVTAYAFGLEKSGDEDVEMEDEWAQDLDGLIGLGLVPMADMLNADAEFNAHLHHQQSRLMVTSLRPIRAGEELLNYYGQLPNSELLLRYGYTSPKHSLFDTVEIQWVLIRQAIHREFGGAVILPSDESMNESYVLERDNSGPDETGIINGSASFIEFPDVLEEQVAPLLAHALGIDIHGQQLPPGEQSRLGRAFIEVMSNAVQARLNQYGTSIATDEELLRAVPPGTRYANALVVRLGEKSLLQEVLDFAANALNDEEPASGEESDISVTNKPQISH